jgi:hypothetical protein
VVWWSNLSDDVPRKHRKELNALVVPVARCLWFERNRRGTGILHTNMKAQILHALL